MKKIFTILGLILFCANSAFAVDVNVYYYWQAPRCATCKKMETYTQNAVQQMNDPAVHFKSVDMSKPENKQAVKKYSLYTKTVILTKTENGKEQWKNLDKIWNKVGSEKDFENYIKTEVKQFKGVK